MKTKILSPKSLETFLLFAALGSLYWNIHIIYGWLHAVVHVIGMETKVIGVLVHKNEPVHHIKRADFDRNGEDI